VLRPDSLVEVGAAGAINQPGGQTTEGEDEAGDNKEGQIPAGSNQEPEKDQQGETLQEESNDDLKNKDEGEEPETEVIGPVVGVVSRSKRSSIRLFNGKGNYNKWVFAFSMPQQQGGPPGGQGGKDKQKSKQKQDQQKPSDQNSQDQEQEQ
jgi:hypothetical protein